LDFVIKFHRSDEAESGFSNGAFRLGDRFEGLRGFRHGATIQEPVLLCVGVISFKRLGVQHGIPVYRSAGDALLSSALAGPINMFGGDTKANSEFGTTLKAHTIAGQMKYSYLIGLVLK